MTVLTVVGAERPPGGIKAGVVITAEGGIEGTQAYGRNAREVPHGESFAAFVVRGYRRPFTDRTGPRRPEGRPDHPDGGRTYRPVRAAGRWYRERT